MAIAKTPSEKRVLITKANQRMVMVAGIAAFLVVFSIVASNTLVKQLVYQNKVITARKQALQVAKANVVATEQLVSQYNAFTSTDQNIIGGSSTGTADRDGNNAQIILNALPSKYDLPALTSSIEKIVASNGMKINAITAVDDEVAQQANSTSSLPTPIEIPFSFSVSGSYSAAQALIKDFERSIRPFQIQTIALSVSGSEITLQVEAKTFFQPAKNLNIREEIVQ